MATSLRRLLVDGCLEVLQGREEMVTASLLTGPRAPLMEYFICVIASDPISALSGCPS